MAVGMVYPPLVNNLQKTLGAGYTAGATTLTLNNVTNIQNEPGVCLINRIDSGGTLQPAANWTYFKYTGTSGSTLTGVGSVAGSTDQDHATGEIVEFVADIYWAQAVIDTFAVGHNVDSGTHTFTTLHDANGNEELKFVATGSAVNEFTVTNGATGNGPTLEATGGDSSIAPVIKGKAAFPKVSGIKDLGTVGATETVSWANGDRQKMTLDENLTITFSNAAEGQTLTLYMLQDGTGTNTITWADTITWQDGITWGTSYYTQTASKMSIAVITYAGSAYYGVISKFAA